MRLAVLKHRWIKFVRLPAGKKRLLLEALLCLGWARMLKAMPFPRIAPTLGRPMQETPFAHHAVDELRAREISQAVRTMSRHTLWQSHCLVQAIAAQRMLARRRIACTLYLGTARDRQGRMVAHAWLRSGTCYVTGAEERKLFTAVAVFGKIDSTVRTKPSEIEGV